LTQRPAGRSGLGAATLRSDMATSLSSGTHPADSGAYPPPS